MYDGDRQRVKKVEGGQTTLYLRSTVLGGQVVGEYNQSGTWLRGYVYDGNAQLLAMQAGGVQWVHTDPVTKSKRVTDRWGNSIAAIDVDPWGGETSRMENSGVLSRKYTTYERDGNGRDQAMQRSYHAWFSRFDQPDPFDGSYDLTNPQSLNRYAYVGNDPVNRTDPTGLCWDENGNFVPCHPVDPNEPPEQVFSNIWSMDFLRSGGRSGGILFPRMYRRESPRGGSEPHQPVPPDNPNNCQTPVTAHTSHTACIGEGLSGCVGIISDGEGKKLTLGGTLGFSTFYSYTTTLGSGNVPPNVYLTGSAIGIIQGISASSPINDPLAVSIERTPRGGSGTFGSPQINVGAQVVTPPIKITGPSAYDRANNPQYTGKGIHRFGPGRCLY